MVTISSFKSQNFNRTKNMITLNTWLHNGRGKNGFSDHELVHQFENGGPLDARNIVEQVRHRQDHGDEGFLIIDEQRVVIRRVRVPLANRFREVILISM